MATYQRQDNIATVEPDMDTTAGSLALVGAKSPKNALVVDRLRKAGLIILGKAQLSVSSLHPPPRSEANDCTGVRLLQVLRESKLRGAVDRSTRGSSLPCGWSAIRGQGQSPYTLQDVRPEDDPVSHNVSTNCITFPRLSNHMSGSWRFVIWLRCRSLCWLQSSIYWD